MCSFARYEGRLARISDLALATACTYALTSSPKACSRMTVVAFDL